MHTTLLEIFEAYGKEQPGRLFAADPAGEITYGEAWRRVKGGAKLLRDRGLGKGERIAVECTQDRRFLLAGFAVHLAGAIFVPIEQNIKEDRLRGILEDTEAALFIVGSAETDARGLPALEMGELLADPGEDCSLALPFPEREQVAEILYTTGTTGKSKGIEITHGNDIALAENIVFGTQMRKQNVELIPLPLSHSHGLRTCYANLYVGGAVVLTDGVSKVKQIYDLIVKYEITALDLSPTAASVLLKLSRGRFSDFNGQLDYIEIGTAALSEELKEQLKKAFPDVRLYNFYGSTEAGRSCVLNFNSDEDRKFCIGRPTKNARFFIVDDSGREIASSAERTGLLVCAGTMNMKGYYRQEELTASVLKDGALFTADEGYLDEDGRVYCLGRKDDVVNYRGIKIAPEEIEEAAMTFKGVKDAALIGREDKNSGQVPVLCYLTDEEDFDETAFSLHLADKIEKERLPKELIRCESIPRTSNGKLRRGQLKGQLYGAEKK